MNLAVGYSGGGSGKNNPALEAIPDLGPIPRGRYTIGDPFDSEAHGPFAIPLTPDPTNDMHGRSGFLMHGDSVQHPGTASEGCIIMPHYARQRVFESDDKILEVV